jgi:hypothetical protein
MPLVYAIKKEGCEKPEIIGLQSTQVAILKDGSEVFLSHPSEPFQLYTLGDSVVRTEMRYLGVEEATGKFVKVPLDSEGKFPEGIISIEHVEDACIVGIS